MTEQSGLQGNCLRSYCVVLELIHIYICLYVYNSKQKHASENQAVCIPMSMQSSEK